MTTILLIDDYFVEVDAYNHTLKKKYMGKDKKTGDKKEMEKSNRILSESSRGFRIPCKMYSTG